MEFIEKDAVAHKLQNDTDLEADLALLKIKHPEHPFNIFVMPRPTLSYEVLMALLDVTSEEDILANRKPKKKVTEPEPENLPLAKEVIDQIPEVPTQEEKKKAPAKKANPSPKKGKSPRKKSTPK